MIGPLPEDIRREEGMIAGSETLYRAIEAHRQGRAFKTSAQLIWWHSAQGPRPDLCAGNSIIARRVAAAMLAKEAAAEANRRHRDPCWRCGTRADYGCKHARPALARAALRGSEQ